MSTITHDHDDADRLTIACPGCIQRVKDDQREAALQEAPLRTISVEWSTRVRGTVEFEAKALPGEDADDVADRNQALIADMIEESYIDRWAMADIEWGEVQFKGTP